MRTVLIPVADRPECAAALKVAFEMARRMSTDVLGYHLRPHRNESAAKKKPAKKSESGDDVVVLSSKAAGTLFEKTAKRFDMTLKKRHALSDAGGQAIWRELTGNAEHVFPIIGPMSDMIVVSRPRNQGSARARAFQMAALMQTGTPVLMLPSRKPASVGKRVLICWNQSVEAAAAVKASVSVLCQAESVQIVAAGKEDGVGAKSRHLQQYLRHWGIDAECISTLGRDVQAEVMSTYVEQECDLLLMGAYSRPRWRERVFGGLTDYVMNKSSIPALMLHR